MRSNSYSIGDDVTRFSFWAQKCHPMGQRFIIGSTQILKNPFKESFYHSPFAPDIKQFAGWLKWQFSFYLALKPSSGSCTSYYQQCHFKSSLLHTFPLKICSIFIAVRPLYFGNERWLLELYAVVNNDTYFVLSKRHFFAIFTALIGWLNIRNSHFYCYLHLFKYNSKRLVSCFMITLSSVYKQPQKLKASLCCLNFSQIWLVLLLIRCLIFVMSMTFKALKKHFLWKNLAYIRSSWTIWQIKSKTRIFSLYIHQN